MIKRFLKVVEVQGVYNYADAKELYAKGRVFSDLRPLQFMTRTVSRKVGESAYRFYIFDLYYLEKLSILQKCLHNIKDIYTTAIRNMGINSRVVVIARNTRFPFVVRTYNSSNQEIGNRYSLS